MRYGKIVAAALVIGALACPLGSCGTAEGAGTAVHGAQAGTMGYHFHENDGLRLRVPLVYNKLLVASPGEAHKGQLFSLTEKASLDAGLKENAAYTGMGWLFGIGRVTEAELHEMLCGDMSGRELFAKDGAGNYYLFYHPTDVRYMRETPEAMQRDQEQWSELCAWAYGELRADFIKDNPGLSACAADNSNVGICLANILYHDGVKYTLSRAGEEPVSGDGFPAGTYGEGLLYDCEFNMIKKDKAPQGDYVALCVPGVEVEFDFYKRGDENFVREKREGLPDHFYKVVSRSGKTDAVQLVEEWQAALAADRDLAKLGYSPEYRRRAWAEKLDRQGNLNLTKGDASGTAKVEIRLSCNFE